MSPIAFQPSKTERKISFARHELQRIGNQLIRGRKLHAEGEQPQGQDLLSVLVRVNLAADLPQSQRMSEQEVVDRESVPGQLGVVFITGFPRNSRLLSGKTRKLIVGACIL